MSSAPPIESPLALLLLQLVVILAATRACGALAARVGQPSVVGEMFGGILLGPSFLGWLLPEVSSQLFPDSSVGTLQLLSQTGLCLFMFVVGMELDVEHLRGRMRTALLVGQSSILAPFFLGALVAPLLFPAFAGPRASFVSFSLFLGASMSITAFPVLARILQERRMGRTALGATAITCAAMGDVTAWSLLAVVVAIARSSGASATAGRLAGAAAFCAATVWIVRPALARWFGAGRPAMTHGVMAWALGFLFASALAAERMGVHALFGAFLAGAVTPQEAGFRHELRLRLESVSAVFLLPLFFAVTGLRTRIGALDGAGSWGFCLLILGVATVGKMAGAGIPARMSGMSLPDAFSLGALMNTRGLMEMVAVNMGYDLGILSPRSFAMLVLMALATTFMTGPLLDLADFWRRRKAAPSGGPALQPLLLTHS